METLILASGSPRRRDLLSKIRIPFKVVPPEIDESALLTQAATDIIIEIARQKAATVAGLFTQESPKWILAADTVVDLDGRILGKPADRAEAESFLRALAGRIHRVHTGLALIPERRKPMVTAICTTEVKFSRLDDAEIDFYLQSEEWSGVAGAYRIQERGGLFVEWVKGSYSNVVGLPLETLYRLLKEQGYVF